MGFYELLVKINEQNIKDMHRMTLMRTLMPIENGLYFYMGHYDTKCIGNIKVGILTFYKVKFLVVYPPNFLAIYFDFLMDNK